MAPDWVTSHGQLLIIEGKYQSGEMLLAGSYLDAKGQKTMVRRTRKPVGKDVQGDGGDLDRRWKKPGNRGLT